MATETTSTSAKAHAPDVISFVAGDVIPEALVLQASTVAGTVEGDAPAVRVPYVEDAAAGFVAEGTAIDEADPGLNETVIYTGKVAQLVRLSREQWRQQGASSMLSDSVRRAVTKAANAAFVAQANPTAPATTPPGGIINTAGIVDGGAVADNLDGLISLIATLEGDGATPSHILIDPVGWSSLRKFKTATGAETSLLGAGTNDAVPMLLGLPVLVSPAVAAGSGLVIDKTDVLSAVGSVEVATSEHVYFNSDSIGLRCTFRFGAKAMHPERLGKFTVTAPVAA